MVPIPLASEPLRIGLLGCGQIAQAHAAALRFLADDGVARVSAVADPDPEGIRRVAGIVGDLERSYSDGRELIDDPTVDAVAVVAPTRFHRDLIAAVASAGKPLFTEKPLAPDFSTVCEIADTVRAAGIPAQVGFQSRFHPIVRQLQDWVVEGELGAPMAYTIRDDQFWPTGAVVPGHSSWRAERSQAGGGALLEHSIHSCDIACWLFGPVARVFASTRHVFGFDVEDVAAITIEHHSGVVGNLVTVFNGVRDREERRIEVFFERAAVEATTDFIIGAPEDSLLLKQDGAPAERFDVDALRRATFAADGFDPNREVFVYQYFGYAAFASALRRGLDPVPGIADAVRAHEVVEAAYQSARTKGAANVADLRSR
jgi:myo-inositol 2-dehydrogenase/D-chiro-inositol 1-dehydrogenase